MLEYSNARNLYMGLTTGSADSITADIFFELDEKHKLGLKKNIQKSTWKTPNGSTCKMFGVDASEKEMRKALGQKLRKVSIDEAGSITIDMKKLIYQMIIPALTDNRPHSWLTILGTPENIPNTFFEGVTQGKDDTINWKVRKWTAYDNPYMVKQWTDEIIDLIKNNPKIVEASWFKTHYLNEWCSDDELLIIPVSRAERCEYKHEAGDVYVLGVDFGFNDSNAFTVIKWSQSKRKMQFVQSFKKAGIIYSEVAEVIKTLRTKYPITSIVVDGQAKQGIEEIKKRFQLPLENAEKTGKATFLKLLKDDILTGVAEICDNGCQELVGEWEALMWKDQNKEDEDPRCQNHASDSALYAWRKAKHYAYTEAEKPVSRDSQQYMDELEKREMENARNRDF